MNNHDLQAYAMHLEYRIRYGPQSDTAIRCVCEAAQKDIPEERIRGAYAIESALFTVSFMRRGLAIDWPPARYFFERVHTLETKERLVA